MLKEPVSLSRRAFLSTPSSPKAATARRPKTSGAAKAARNERPLSRQRRDCEGVTPLTAPSPARAALALALLQAREAVMTHFRPLLAQYELTEQQWRVLRALSEHGPSDASSLAQRACLLAPSLTRILRVLEARRLTQRRIDAQDGRRILLGLTPAGVRLIEKIWPQSQALYSAIERRHGDERIARLIEALNAFVDTEANANTSH